MNDEQAIRNLIERWFAAAQKGDVPTQLSLLAEDVVFMVPGREPFGKQEFAAAADSLKDVEIQGRSEIQELVVIHDWAWMRSRLEVTMRPSGGMRNRRGGYVLTILRKKAEGDWVIARDANLMGPPETEKT